MSKGAELIAAERQRQIDVEGWTADHDDGHNNWNLSQAGATYAFHAHHPPNGAPLDFPWGQEWWKPTVDPVRNLVKAGALIAAEIDRLLRASGQDV